MVASVLWSYLVYQWSVTGIIRMSTKLPLRKILNRINSINTQKAEKNDNDLYKHHTHEGHKSLGENQDCMSNQDSNFPKCILISRYFCA